MNYNDLLRFIVFPGFHCSQVYILISYKLSLLLGSSLYCRDIYFANNDPWILALPSYQYCNQVLRRGLNGKLPPDSAACRLSRGISDTHAHA